MFCAPAICSPFPRGLLGPLLPLPPSREARGSDEPGGAREHGTHESGPPTGMRGEASVCRALRFLNGNESVGGAGAAGSPVGRHRDRAVRSLSPATTGLICVTRGAGGSAAVRGEGTGLPWHRCRDAAGPQTHRIESDTGLGGKGPLKAIQSQPPAVGRDIFNRTRLLRAPSNPAWNVPRDGASTAALGNLDQGFTTLHVKSFFLKSSLTFPSFSLNHYPFSYGYRPC